MFQHHQILHVSAPCFSVCLYICMYVYMHVCHGNLGNKLTYPCIFTFFMDEKNSYCMSQINTKALPQSNIDINVTST